MTKYRVEEWAMRSTSKDLAVIFDQEVIVNRAFDCWMNNPAIVGIFDLPEEVEEYYSWLDSHKGEWEFEEENE